MPLGDCVVENSGGGTPSRSRSEYWNGGIPWASVGDVTATKVSIASTRQTITSAGLEGSSTSLVPAGWVVVAVKIAPGAMRVVERDLAINQDLRGLHLTDLVDPYFLTYHFKTIRVVGNGTIVKGMTNQALLRIRVPVPPLEVQREIVRVLDRFTRLEAELEETLEAELEARKQQYAYYRPALLTLDPNSGGVPLNEIADYANGKAHEKLADPDGTVPMVTARFVSRNGEANRFVRAQDVLMPADAGDIALVLSDLPNGRALARTFYVDRANGYAINQRVARIRVKDPEMTDPRYLFHVLDRNPGLLKYDNGADQTHLSKSQVTGLLVPVPPIDQQRRAARLLDQLKSLIDEVSASLSAESAARRKQYEFYRDKLLTFEEVTA
nr:restriction endonuclease subunit S [Demequina sp. NBRC 110056]